MYTLGWQLDKKMGIFLRFHRCEPTNGYLHYTEYLNDSNKEEFVTRCLEKGFVELDGNLFIGKDDYGLDELRRYEIEHDKVNIIKLFFASVFAFLSIGVWHVFCEYSDHLSLFLFIHPNQMLKFIPVVFVLTTGIIDGVHGYVSKKLFKKRIMTNDFVEDMPGAMLYKVGFGVCLFVLTLYFLLALSASFPAKYVIIFVGILALILLLMFISCYFEKGKYLLACLELVLSLVVTLLIVDCSETASIKGVNNPWNGVDACFEGVKCSRYSSSYENMYFDFIASQIYSNDIGIYAYYEPKYPFVLEATVDHHVVENNMREINEPLLDYQRVFINDYGQYLLVDENLVVWYFLEENEEETVPIIFNEFLSKK